MSDINLPQNNKSPVVHEYFIEKKDAAGWYIPLSQISEMHLSLMTEDELDNNWKLDEFFGVITVINLPQSQERLKSITQQLNEIGTQAFEIFRAIDGRKEVDPSIWKKFQGNRLKYDPRTEAGRLALDDLHQAEAGCYLSHYSAIKKTKEAFEKAIDELDSARQTQDNTKIHQAEISVRKYSRVLILEDDGGFGILNKKKTRAYKRRSGKILRSALLNLPDDWELLYFVVNATEPSEAIAPHLRKLKSSWCCVAYAVNYTMYTPLIDELKKIEDPTVECLWPIDCVLSSMHHSHNIYAIYPSIVYHQAGISEITSKNRSELWQGQPIYSKEKKSKR